MSERGGGTFTDQKGVNMDEQARLELERRCHEVVGATESSVLTTVLSYFPDKAELFIRTQEHAAAIEGRRQVWWIIRHKKDGKGLGGSAHRSGEMEHLGLYGFTGEDITRIITEVDVMRGFERGHTDASVSDLIDVARKMPRLREASATPPDDTPLFDYEQMAAKTLEVLQVTRQEIRLLRAYQNMEKQANVYLIEIERLKLKVAALRTSSNALFPSLGLEGEQHYEQWRTLERMARDAAIVISRDDDRVKFVLDAESGEICVLAKAGEVFKLVVLAFRCGNGMDGPCGGLLNLFAWAAELTHGVGRTIVWHRHIQDASGVLPQDKYVTLRDWLTAYGYNVEALLG